MFGRSRANDTPLSDPHVSRVHCQLVPEGDGYAVVDFDSASGTFVNGKEVNRHVLQSGDLIRIGGTHMQYVVETDRPVAAQPAQSPNAWARALVGQTMSNYKITAPLAPGKSGFIFHAEHVPTETAVAFKVLRAEFGKDEKKVQHFIDAMKKVMPLSYVHLLKILGAGKTGDHCWIATEYVAGESLAAVVGRIPKSGKLDWKAVTRVGVYLSRALEYAHGKGLNHQNVTPQNVLVGKKPQNTKLIDLMLSTAIEEDPTKPISAAGLPSESLPFMSPERTDGPGAAIDARTDIYSHGATIYAMLTGKPPFQGTTVNELIDKIRYDAPHHFQSLQADAPTDLEKLVRRCLAKRPQDRPASAGDLRKELEKITQTHGIPL
jgi:serine/threonine-protein kinase